MTRLNQHRVPPWERSRMARETRDRQNADDVRTQSAPYRGISACGCPPAAPANVAQTFRIREYATGVKYDLHVGFDYVDEDIYSGHTIVDRYSIQMQPCNAAGTAIAGEKPRVKTVHAPEPGESDPDLEAILYDVRNPKTWRWKSRVRAIDPKNRKGPWSAWTSPLLPTADPNVAPPSPAGVTVTFDRIEEQRYVKLRARVRCNEITNWDIPGFDSEADVDSYEFQLRRSNSNGTFNANFYNRTNIVKAFATDGDPTVAQAIFWGINNNYYYRARVRAIDRFNRRGPWSSYTAAATPNDTTAPPLPTNVTGVEGLRRVGARWETPADPSNAELPHPDVVYYQIKIRKGPTYVSKRSNNSSGASPRTFQLLKPIRTYATNAMYGFFAFSGGSDISIGVPSGWTLVHRKNSGTTFGIAIYRKIAGAAEAGPYNFVFTKSGGGTVAIAGGIGLFKGILGGGSEVHDVNSTVRTNDTVIRAPGINVPSGLNAQDYLCVHFYAHNASGKDISPPGSDTEAFETVSTVAADMMVSFRRGTDPPEDFGNQDASIPTASSVTIGATLILLPVGLDHQDLYHTGEVRSFDDADYHVDHFPRVRSVDAVGNASDWVRTGPYRPRQVSLKPSSDPDVDWYNESGLPLMGTEEEGAVATSLFGLGMDSPVFYWERTVESTISLSNGAWFEYNALTSGNIPSLVIDRPCKVYLIGTATLANPAAIGYSVLFSLTIADDATVTRGLTQVNWYPNDSQGRIHTNSRHARIAASATPDAPANVTFRWGFKQNTGVARNITVKRLKLQAAIFYAPTATNPQWTDEATTKAAYGAGETSDA